MRAPTSGTFQRWIQMVNPENTFDYNRALIQFVLSNPLVDVALIGMRSAKRVEENVAICEDLIFPKCTQGMYKHGNNRGGDK